MSRPRERHAARTPIEEVVRQAAIDLLGSDGTVYVERSGHGDLDSVLVQVSLGESIPVPRSVQLQHELRDLCLRLFNDAGPGLVRNFVCEARSSRRGIISEPGGQRSSYGAGLVKRSA
jgi:hypothetical protein